MLTARNAILTWIVLLGVSVIWSAWTMTRPPDSGGLAEDSYGTHWRGHRAILEVLQETQRSVRRSLAPPDPKSLGHSTLVLWNPNPSLVRVEGVWLKQVAEWVRSGGRLVIAITESSLESVSCPNGKCTLDGSTRSITEAVGLSDVSIIPSESATERLEKLTKMEHPFEDVPDLIRKTKQQVLGKSNRVAQQLGELTASGDWSKPLSGVKRVTLPAGPAARISGGETQRTGTVLMTDAFGERCVAASYQVERGEVVCVSIPELLSNGCVGETDNVIFASSLLSSGDRGVVFDEFFHGLSVRGNPMWLFSQRTYGSVTVCLLVLAGVWAWRGAIRLGPPLTFRTVSRRSIGDYVDAMSRFFQTATGARRFLIAEVRDGVIWHIRKEFRLPPEGEDREHLLSVMRRRDPARAVALYAALQDVDQLLSSPAVARESCETAMKRITECL